MGTKLTGRADFAPTAVVGVTREPGKMFKGRLLGPGREVKVKKGKKMVYEFTAIDTDMQTQMKNVDGTYSDYALNPDEKVAIFAPTVLHKALLKAVAGQVITILYLGIEQTKAGVDFHNFDVEAD